MDLKPADRALGDILVEKGLLTRDQLNDCFREQSEARGRGGLTFLGHIVLRRGLVDVDQLSEMLLLQQKRGFAIKEDPLEVVDATVLSGAFGRFTILQRIGMGGTAAVYLAFDEVLKRLVALKILTANLSPGGTIVDRFIKEAQTLARLSHPNLIRIYDTGIIGGLQYIAMEYVQGRDLEEAIDRRELTPDRIAPVVRDLCSCISYAHERGIIHRDLKPSNIMIEERSGRIVVMDFGIARSMDEHTKLTVNGSILGTPSYMSPEQVRGEMSDIDARTDVYGAGAILYECLTGHPPFDGKSEREVFERILNDEPPDFPADSPAPKDLIRICLKAMDKDPRGRYGSMTEMREDLERFLQGRPVLARPPQRATILVRKMRRHKAVIAIVGLLAAGIVAFAAFFVVSQVQRGQQLDELTRDGDAAFEAGRFEDALRAYELALNLDPRNEYFQDRRAACGKRILGRGEQARLAALAEQNRRERITRANQVFVETQEVVTGARKHLYKAGDTVADIRRDVEGILAKLDAALVDAPLADGFYLKGRVYHLLGDVPAAQACYDRALELDAAHSLSRIYLGRLLIERSIVESSAMMSPERQRRFLDVILSEALRQLEGVQTGAEFEKKDNILARGYFHLARRQFDEALELGKKAAQDHGDEEFHYLCGLACIRLLRYEDAVGHFTRAIAGRINYFEAYFMRGMSYQYGGKSREMEADYRKCVEINPWFASSWNNLGVFYKAQQNLDAAMECFDRSIAADPSLVNAYVNLGATYRLLRRDREAVSMYDRAVKIDPLHDEAYFSRGIACGVLGDWKGAMESYNFCLEINPRHPNALINRGNLFQRINKLEEAVRDYTSALAVSDSWLVYNNRGHVRLAQQDWENALSDFEAALSRNRGSALSFAGRGIANLKLGRYEEAVSDLEKAKSLDRTVEPFVRPHLEEARKHVSDDK